VTVRITSSNPDVLLVSRNSTTVGTPFVDIPVANGSIDATFFIQGVEGAQGTVTLTATAPGFTQVQGTATVGDVGLQLGLTTSTTTLSPDSPFNVSVGVLNAAGSFSTSQPLRPGAASLTVTVSHTNTAVAQLVTTSGTGQSRTVTIAAGQSSSPGSVAAGGVAFDPLGGGTTTVSATATGFRPATPVTVTVTAPGISLLSFPTNVGAALQAGASTARLGASAHGGVTVRITSSDPGILLVSRNATTVGSEFIDIPVANGSTDAPYFVQGVADARGTATVTVTAPGFTSAQGNVNVVAPALDIQSLPSTIAATAASVVFQVRVGIADTFNNTVSQVQSVAAGSSLVATVTNSAAGVAQLVTAAGGAQSRPVTIPGGSSQSPATVASGGIEFDPLTAGATTVVATIPGVVTTAAGSVTVTVTGGTAPLSNRSGPGGNPKKD
jgi:hypothetical protein